MPTITVIPATRNRFTADPITNTRKRRVAGYARVSTDKDEQQTSYVKQVEYYTDYIQKNPDWEFAGLYADEGISGVSTKKRNGFNKMIEDALAGKIDLIITKSVSRFARNTVDTLVNVRLLKEAGCECYFEEQNVWTFDSAGELLLTVLSSIAQEEARNISENVTWGQRKRFADGKVSLPYKHFLGYDKGEDGRPRINPAEAEIVRRIYRLYINGKTPGAIARTLEADGIKSPSGKDRWGWNVVMSILTNEKYKGDALLQKKFTEDYLTKKKVVNTGQVPQYYVEGSHQAIIDPKEWEMVQAEVERRKGIGKAYSSGSVLSSKLICGDCGDFFGPKVWHSTDKYRKEIWQCGHKFKGGKICDTPHLTVEQIQALFMDAYNRLMREDPAQLIADCALMLAQLLDTSDLNREITAADEKMAVTSVQIAALVNENAVTVQAQDLYNEKYAALEKRYKREQAERERLEKQIESRKGRAKELEAYIAAMQENGTYITEWDDTLWLRMVSKAIVHTDGSVTFVFKDGKEISVKV